MRAGDKECLMKMMKASQLRGQAGELGLALLAALLIMTLLGPHCKVFFQAPAG